MDTRRAEPLISDLANPLLIYDEGEDGTMLVQGISYLLQEL